jgi:hypothetical protein
MEITPMDSGTCAEALTLNYSYSPFWPMSISTTHQRSSLAKITTANSHVNGKISGSYSDGYEEFYLHVYNAM